MTRLLPGALLVLAGCASGGSSGESRVTATRVIVRAQIGSRVSLVQSRVEPTSALLGMTTAADQIEIEVRSGTASITVQTPGACPLELPLAEVQPGEITRATVRPWLSAAGGDLTQVGFDAPFTVTLTPGCREALTSKVEWKQTGGAPIELSTEQGGLVVRGRTPSFNAPVPWGVVPLSPRTRGEIELTATSGAHSLKVRVSAAARSSGLPSLALSQRVFLGGAGWRVKERAKDGKAEVVTSDSGSAFQPDARGRWVLADADGRDLSLVVGTHSETLLDSRRSECHAKATEKVQTSRMTRVFERGLSGQLPRYDVSCALPCHTAGEPGLPDGGFSQVSDELGLSGHFEIRPDAHRDLPRPLRRLAGVTCTACHGPGAIPEPAARWAVLRTDLCATCHDAPPRYGHVQAWLSTRMAQADRDPAARQQAACRGCHSTAGFLGPIGVRKDDGPTSPDLALGIGCAACHAPHGDHTGGALLRALPAPTGWKLPETALPSRVCVECHAGPDASAATLLFDHDAIGAHALVPKGCIGCHAGPAASATARGRNHSFEIDQQRCSRGCHDEGVPKADPTIPARTDAALRALGLRVDSKRPLHARKLDSFADPKRREALDLARQLAGDGAAAVHDARRARALLDRIESLLGMRRP